MSLENEPKQPSAEQRAFDKIERAKERLREDIQTDEQGEYFQLMNMEHEARGKEAIEKAIEQQALLGSLNNFPLKIPSISGKFRETKELGEGFSQDLSNAIEEAGVDREKLEHYVDHLLNVGLYSVDGKLHKELILPIFIKLIEKGYDPVKLCT